MNKVDFNNKIILITGGAGFIGSNLALYLQRNYPKAYVVVFDCFRNETSFSNGNLQSLGHYKNLVDFKGDVLCGNINNKDDLALLNNYKFDYIFHQAAVSDTRVDDQEIIIKTNVNAFYDLLSLAKKHSSVMVYASSAAVYGNLPAPQTVGKEDPKNTYGFSKYTMDNIAYRYAKDNPKMAIVGLRFFNVYGKGEYYKGKTASMVVQLGHQILAGRSPKLFFNSNKILRDFVYIDDAIQANIKAAAAKKNGIYNVGSGVARSFVDINNILQQELNTNLSIKWIKNPYSGYQTYTKADIKSAKVGLGYEPKISLEAGIKDYLPEIARLFNENVV